MSTATARSASDEFGRPTRYDRGTGPKAAALMVGTAKNPPNPDALPKLPATTQAEEE